MNLAIIGCGNIGFRHFQSILNLKCNCQIFLIDNSVTALSNCKKYLDANPNLNLKISFFDNFDKISSNLDIIIIATSAFPRRNIIEKIYDRKKPKYIILEKFLFPKLEDYKFCENLFTINKTKVWVNQWMGNEFENLKKYFPSNEKIDFKVSGENWGLCCNSVHYIDWFHSLVNREEMEVKSINIEHKLYESKRTGYYELFGNYEIISKSGHRMILKCDRNEKKKEEDREIFINIHNIKNQMIAELKPEYLDCKINQLYNKSSFNTKIPIKYQSQRTSHIIQNLINSDTCNLVSYENSVKHHLLIFEMINNIFKSTGYDVSKGIPIT